MLQGAVLAVPLLLSRNDPLTWAPLLGQAFFRFVNGQLGRLQHALDSHYSVRDTDLDGWDQLWEIAVYVHHCVNPPPHLLSPCSVLWLRGWQSRPTDGGEVGRGDPY